MVSLLAAEDNVVPTVVVFDVTETRRGDFAYFTALKQEIEGDGLQGFLSDMLDMNFADWHPLSRRRSRRPPMVN